MAELAFPPGAYPVVVIGSGPGALQVTYDLRRSGVEHATISADDEPGGMFRRFPIFERLITWTKPYAPVPRGERAYEWYDWNSLLGAEPELRAVLPPLMDGTSQFPSRAEMEAGLAAFARKAALRIRHGCRWTGTRRREEGGFVVETTDGEYECRILIVAVGMTQPWKPNIPGLAEVPHYVDTEPREAYTGKRVLVVGKRNSAFEIADGLLPVASQLTLVSPRPARISVLTHSTAAARARYLQPYEDHALGGGTRVLDAVVDGVERRGDGYRVALSGTTRPGSYALEVDAVIAATGFTTPLVDLPALGAATFSQGRLPVQTAYWESATLPGVHFAGSITQGSIGMKKYGTPSNSAAVHGFRYNARVLAEHLAETVFGLPRPRPAVEPERVVPYLLDEATRAPELWNQQSYLARVLSFDEATGIRDEGIVPLQPFVDGEGPDAVAVAVETDPEGNMHPAVYLRREGRVQEHLLEGHELLDFTTDDHHRALEALLGPVLAGGAGQKGRR